MALNTHTVLIKVKQMGSRKVSREMKGLTVGLTAVGLAAAGMAREIIRASDEMTNLGNKSRVFARTQGEAANRMATVISTARTMNMEMNGVADVMQRVSMSADQVGLSNQEVTKMVSNLSKATMLSGATAQEATGALRQFGQALAANRLSGQELNSILEQTPMIARLIADSMGVAVGELRALGKQGLITAEVMKTALATSIDDLDRKFSKFEFPIAALMVSAKRETTLLINSLSELTGAGQLLRNMAQGLVDSLVDLNRSFAVGGEQAQKFVGFLNTTKDVVLGLFAAFAGNALVKFIAGLFASVKAAGGLRAALIALPNPYLKLAGVVLTVASVLFSLDKGFGDVEVTAKKNVKTLENVQSALGAITNADAKGIRFWKEQFDAASQTTEEFRENLEALAHSLDRVDISGYGQLTMGGATNFEGAATRELTRLGGEKNQLLPEQISRAEPMSDTKRELEARLVDVKSQYDSLTRWLQSRLATLAETGKKLPANLRAELSDLREDLDPNFDVDSVQIGINRINELRKNIAAVGPVTDDVSDSLNRMVGESLNNMAKLIPELDAMPGTIDTTSYAYTQLIAALEGTAFKFEELGEIQKRTREREEETAQAKLDQLRLLQREQALMDKLAISLNPIVDLKRELNLLEAQATEQFGEGTEKLTAFLVKLKEYEDWQVRQLARGVGVSAGFGPSIQQADADQGQQDMAVVGAALDTAKEGGNQEEIDHLTQLQEFMQRRLDMNAQLREDQTAMQVMNQGLLEGELSAAELREGAFASMREGFASVAGPALDLGANISKITAAGVGGLTNSITEMATTGKGSFKELGKSFLTMITQMIVQMTVMMALVTAIGMLPGGSAMLELMGMSGGGMGGKKPGKAAGGPVAGGQPYMVGERGPELFVPPQSGSMKSNRDLAGMGQQPPQVTVVNVDSSENTLSAMGSEEGESVIMNVIQRNPEILRSIS